MSHRRRNELWSTACFLEDEEAMSSQREAVRLMRRAIDMGQREALGNLAYAYDRGRGVRPSRKSALGLWRKDWRGGSTTAARNIALTLLEEGRATSAILWLRRAIASGDPDARLDLATLLLSNVTQQAEAQRLLEEFVHAGPQVLTEVSPGKKPVLIEDERYTQGVRLLEKLKGQPVA